MNCYEKIKSIASALDIPAYPNAYTKGDLNKWVTYNLSDRQPVLFGNDFRGYYVDYVQVHLFMPMSENFFGLMQSISDALEEAGFTAPDVMLNVENSQHLQHLTFSCSIVEEE